MQCLERGVDSVFSPFQSGSGSPKNTAQEPTKINMKIKNVASGHYMHANGGDKLVVNGQYLNIIS